MVVKVNSFNETSPCVGWAKKSATEEMWKTLFSRHKFVDKPNQTETRVPVTEIIILKNEKLKTKNDALKKNDWKLTKKKKKK